VQAAHVIPETGTVTFAAPFPSPGAGGAASDPRSHWSAARSSCFMISSPSSTVTLPRSMLMPQVNSYVPASPA
jgi:hypothetical protein